MAAIGVEATRATPRAMRIRWRRPVGAMSTPRRQATIERAARPDLSSLFAIQDGRRQRVPGAAGRCDADPPRMTDPLAANLDVDLVR